MNYGVCDPQLQQLNVCGNEKELFIYAYNYEVNLSVIQCSGNNSVSRSMIVFLLHASFTLINAQAIIKSPKWAYNHFDTSVFVFLHPVSDKVQGTR